MAKWQPNPRTLKRPVYLSLVSQISQAIDQGLLQAGDRLPPQRNLAHDLDVAVQTVSRAYDELARRGLASGQTGRGTFVAPRQSETNPPYIHERGGEIIDLSMLKPVVEQMHLDLLRQGIADVSVSGTSNLHTSFRPNVVFARHRDVGVGWLKGCGLETAPRNIILTNGATPAMTTALLTAARPGTTIATEAVGHHTLPALAGSLGMTLRGITLDEEGIIPAELEHAVREEGLKTLFVMPNPCGPTLSMMGLKRRQEIVEVARQHDLQIVENDAWGPLTERRPPPLAALAPERTYYITSLTKCVMPGLRFGYLAVPERTIPAANNRHLVTNWMATPLMVELATRWIENGTAQKLVARQRKLVRRRHKIATEELHDVALRSHPDALHIWVPLEAERTEDSVVSLARQQGIAIAPGSSFTIGNHSDPAVRICLGQPSERDLRDALSIVASILASEPEPALLA